MAYGILERTRNTKFRAIEKHHHHAILNVVWSRGRGKLSNKDVIKIFHLSSNSAAFEQTSWKMAVLIRSNLSYTNTTFYLNYYDSNNCIKKVFF